MAVEPQSHMIVMPKAFLALRIFQMVFAVFVLGVCIYGAIGDPVSGIVLNIFTAIATIITLIYIFVATYSQPIIYQYWAILGLEIFCLIFWLISFALLASEVAVAASYDCGGYYDGYGDYVEETCSSATLGIIGLFGACAGVGGIEFVLFIASLSLLSVRLYNHRQNGGHCTPGAMAAAAAAPFYPNQQAGQEKVEMQPQIQAYPTGAAPPPNGYYPPQGGDVRYGAAPMAQPGQQYQQQMPPQQVPQQMAAPQGQYVQQPAYVQQQQQAPVQYQQQQQMPQ